MSEFCLGSQPKSLIQDFATLLARLPQYGNLWLRPAAETAPGQIVLDILHSKTAALVTDAASDEMKSGRMLSGKESASLPPACFQT